MTSLVAAARRKEIKSYLPWLTLAMLAVGYADLVRGGTAVAAIALSVAYCALVPAAIWLAFRPPARPGNSGARGRGASSAVEGPSYLVAGLTALGVLALYLATLAPSTAMWDTSEYIAAAYVFGIPHPPGNPLFVILGHLFSMLPLGGSVARRINVLAAVSSAAAAGFWCLVLEQTLMGWITPRWQRRLGAVLGTLIGATTFTVWNQSVVNEKVYTVSLVGLAIISWLMIRWSDDPDGPKADRLLLLVAYLLGLGYANHMAGMLAAPAAGLAVLIIRPKTYLRWRLVLGALALMVLGLTPFATQPIRAAYFPAINEGEPTACRTKLEWSCTFSQGTLDAFEYNFNRGQYGKPELSDRQATLPQQIGMYWLYFKWQWLRDPDDAHPAAQALLALLYFALGLAGAWRHCRDARRGFWYFGTLMFTVTLLLVYYLNFKLGFSQDPSNPAAREVRDRDYFFLWSFSAWGVWAGGGLMWLWDVIAAAAHQAPRAVRYAAFSPVFALALVPMVANRGSAPRSHHHFTGASAADLLNSVEPYGVLITVGDNDTFPLWWAQNVEGVRRDVIVANTSLLNTDWYVRQLIRRPLYDYDEAKGPAIYRGKPRVKPSDPPIHMTLAQADSVPPYFALQQPMVFPAHGIHATVDPHKLEYGVLQRADLFVLRMIQDAWPQRPIYFARSDGGYAQSLGLGNDVLTQGLASKLFVPPMTATKDTVYVDGDGWYDLPRSDSLWRGVFTAPAAAIREGQWVDRASVSMPYLYLFVGAELAEVLHGAGRTAEANAVLGTARRVAVATRLESVLGTLTPPAAAPASGAGDSNGVTLAAPHVTVTGQPATPSTEPRAKPKKRP